MKHLLALLLVAMATVSGIGTGELETNMSIRRLNWVPYTNPEPEYWAASDAPAGYADIFAKTRNNFSSDMPRLKISLGNICEGENIYLQITYLGQPVEGADVGLYRQGGGRELVSEVSTDKNGWAVFGPKEPGRYDALATKIIFVPQINATTGYVEEKFPFGQEMFVIKPCYLPAQDANHWAKEEKTQKIIAKQNYNLMLERQLEAIRLVNGREAVLARIIFVPNATMKNITLVEHVPQSIATGNFSLGFDGNYPKILDENESMALSWNFGRVEEGRPVVREYIILRPISALAASAFSPPEVLDENNSSIFEKAKNETGKIKPEEKKEEGKGFELPQLSGAAAQLLGVGVILVLAAGLIIIRKRNEESPSSGTAP